MFQQLLANKHHRLRDSVPITIWPSGGLRLVTDKKKKNKSHVKQEPRSAHGRAVKNVRTKPHESSAQYLSFEWSHTRASSTDLQVRLTLHRAHNKQYHVKVLLNSFHLNGHTLGLHLQTYKLD